MMYEVAALFDKHDSSLRSRVTTRKDELVVRFLKSLSENFKEHRSVQYYAQQLFVTPKYLSQAVKSVMGKSAGELIDDIVTMEAKLLLQDASLSIAQVANSLYFSDQFFFSKFFKKHTGQNPSDYRRAA
jgi:AraC family transcriptional regulator, transcriptional activator of pobA